MNHILLQPPVLIAVIGKPLLAAAGWFSWRSGRVPNGLMRALLLTIMAVAWVVGLPAKEILWRAVVFGGSFVCFADLFAWIGIGAGAVKLVVVTTLWLPPTFGAAFAVACLVLIATLHFAWWVSESD